MKHTNYQKKVLNHLRMSKVIWRDMWVSEHALGYSSKGKRRYDINVASDYPDEDVKDIVLLHELGHQYYGHLDQVDLVKEMNDIKSILVKKNLPYSTLRYYGGPHSFINIAMDCYINTTLLTKNNCKYMNEHGLKICTPDAYGIDFQNDFRKYYEPLIDRIPENFNSENGNGDNESGMSADNGNGSGHNSGQGNDNNENSSSEALSDELKDLPETVSSFNEDIDSDIAEEIREESYKSGGEKATVNNVSTEETVQEVETKNEEKLSGGDSSIRGGNVSGDGAHCSSEKFTEFSEMNPEKKIKNFLSSIVSLDMSFKIDALRHHNHGTRRNANNILYSSRKRQHNINKKKLGVLIDVSSSMDADSLITAISSLKDSMNLISDDSIVVTWDTEFCNEWNIRKVPNHIPEGGCTELSGGIDYLNKKGCNDIVLYSDMGTDMDRILESLDRFNGNLYTIIVSNGYDEYGLNTDSGRKYIERNTSYIRI